MPMRFARPSFCSLVTVLWLLVTLAPSARAQNRDATDAARLLRALEVAAGRTVAEIGAGDGALTLTMAREVGPTGRVYSTELGADRVKKLQSAVDEAKLPQITVVGGDAAATNLPEGCCDALFMRLVYHHFADPAAMNASLMRSLKPGGRLAVIDFGPKAGREADKAEDRDEGDRHGVLADTVAAELKQAGFEVALVDKGKDREFMVVARKPM